MKKTTLAYREHYAFSSLTDSLPLPHLLVEQFNNYYNLIEKRKNFLKCKSLSSHLQNLLKGIFDDLESSAIKQEDSNLKLFLRELYFHANQLLIRDLQNKLLYPVSPLPIRNSNELSIQSQIWAGQMLNEKFFNGVISDSVIQTLQSIAKPIIQEFRNNCLNGNTNRESLSINEGEIVSHLTSIVNSEFRRIGVNDALSIYCSYPMKVGGLALELSVPTATWWKDRYGCYVESPKTLYMHTDESISVPKAIIYLTEASEENGAFSTVPNALDIILSPSPLQFLLGRIIGSIGINRNSALFGYYQHHYHQTFGCPKFRKHFMSLPEELQYSSHFGWDIIPESSLENELIAQEIVHSGNAGCYTVFDGGYLVHRGGLVKSGDRIALQVCFTPNPTFKRRLSAKAKSFVKQYIIRQT